MKTNIGQLSFFRYATFFIILVVLNFSLFFANLSYAAVGDLTDQIIVLKKLRDDGVLTEEEFTKAKKILLENVETSSTSKTSEKLKKKSDTKSKAEVKLAKKTDKVTNSQAEEVPKLFSGDINIKKRLNALDL